MNKMSCKDSNRNYSKLDLRMKPFVVLTVGENFSNTGVEMAIRSFSKLFHKVTASHRQKMVLSIVDAGAYQAQIKAQAKANKVEQAVQIVKTNAQTEAMQSASILFAPTYDLTKDLINKAFKNALPVLTFAGNEQECLIDSSCGITLPYRSEERSVSDFCDYLQMLYFDPAARQFLQKGAIKRSQYKPRTIQNSPLSMAS